MKRRAFVAVVLALVPAPLLAAFRGGPYWPTPALFCERGRESTFKHPWPAETLFNDCGQPLWGRNGCDWPMRGERLLRGRVASALNDRRARVAFFDESSPTRDDSGMLTKKPAYTMEMGLREAYNWVMAGPRG